MSDTALVSKTGGPGGLPLHLSTPSWPRTPPARAPTAAVRLRRAPKRAALVWIDELLLAARRAHTRSYFNQKHETAPSGSVRGQGDGDGGWGAQAAWLTAHGGGYGQALRAPGTSATKRQVRGAALAGLEPSVERLAHPRDALGPPAQDARGLDAQEGAPAVDRSVHRGADVRGAGLAPYVVKRGAAHGLSIHASTRAAPAGGGRSSAS